MLDVCRLRTKGIRIKFFKGICENGCQNTADVQILSDLFGGDCPFIVHATYPYRLTGRTGGCFTWVQPSDGVIVQCCSSEPRLITKTYINQERGKNVYTKVIETSDCPSGYKAGDVICNTARPGICEEFSCGILPCVLSMNPGECKDICCNRVACSAVATIEVPDVD
jgi:hypothetical protein